MVVLHQQCQKVFLAHSLCLITAVAGSLVVFGAGWMSSSASQSNPCMYFMWVNLSTWRWPPWGYMSYVRILNESHQCESWIGPRSDQGRILWSSQGDWILWYYMILFESSWYDIILYDMGHARLLVTLVSRYLQVYPSKSRHCHDQHAVLYKTKRTTD